MKTVLVSIGLCLAATAVHAMPLSLLNADGAQPVITVSDQCGDRCGSSRSYLGYRQARHGLATAAATFWCVIRLSSDVLSAHSDRTSPA